jgi:hypothetical protein
MVKQKNNILMMNKYLEHQRSEIDIQNIRKRKKENKVKND